MFAYQLLICDSASQNVVCGLPWAPETLTLNPLVKTLVIIGKLFPFLHCCLNFVDVAKAVVGKNCCYVMERIKAVVPNSTSSHCILQC